jgi:hypothetical protein
MITFLIITFFAAVKTTTENLYIQAVAGYGVAGFYGDGLATVIKIDASTLSGNIWVDSSGNVYLPDEKNYVIRKIDTNGYMTTFGGTGVQVTTGAGGQINGVTFWKPSCIVGDTASTFFYFSDQMYVWRYEFATEAIYVYAGQSTQGYEGDGDPAISAKLGGPTAMWLTTGGDLYFIDYGNAVIRMISSDGIINTVAGFMHAANYYSEYTFTAGDGGPALSASFDGITGLYMNTIGDLFIADFKGALVWKIAASEGFDVIRVFAGMGNGYTNYNGDNIPATAAQIALKDVKGDSLGNIYIADKSNCRIRKVNPLGIMTTHLGNQLCEVSVSVTTSQSLNAPIGLWIDSKANLYFQEEGNIVRRTIPASSASFPTVSPTVSAPNKIYLQPVYSRNDAPVGSTPLVATTVWVNSDGEVFFGEGLLIRKVSLNGIVTTFAGSTVASLTGASGSLAAVRFNSPYSFASDSSSSYLYISDQKFIWQYVYSTGIVSVIAGTTASGFSGDDGLSSSAKLNEPHGIWLTTAGVLYIADHANHRIRKIASGIITTVVGTAVIGYIGDNGPASIASLQGPKAVFVASTGRIFIADAGNNRIRVVDTNSFISLFAGNGNVIFNGDGIPATIAGLTYPSDVKGDTAGNIYITTGSHRVQVVDITGIIRTFAGNGMAHLNAALSPLLSSVYSPEAVWIDSQNTFYVVELYSIRKTVISTTSTPSFAPNSLAVVNNVPLWQEILAGGFKVGSSGDGGLATLAEMNPGGLWVNSASGDMFIADLENHRFRKITKSNGMIDTFAGNGLNGIQGNTGPAGAISLYQPHSIVGDTIGDCLYMSDRWYVWKYTFATNILTVIAGFFQAGFSGDNGPALSSRLNSPKGLWLTTSGVLYIADEGNNRVRRIVSDIITTVAGSTTPLSFTGDNGPATSAGLSVPSAVYMDSIGRLFVSDAGNRRIRWLDTSGIINTFAGKGGSVYNGNNIPATLAGISLLNDIKGDTLGNIYIAETACRVRVISAAGIISDFMGDDICVLTPVVGPVTWSMDTPMSLWIDSQGVIYFSCFRGSIHRTIVMVETPSPTMAPSALPTMLPSSQPSTRPSSLPTTQPTIQPTRRPSAQPSRQPSNQPSTQPTNRPSKQPTGCPSSQPTTQPISSPSSQPSLQPIAFPTVQPTNRPSGQPTARPSSLPSRQPTSQPSCQPSGHPTKQPSSLPSSQPTAQPSLQPVVYPTAQPTSQPTTRPSRTPSARPSVQPTTRPSSFPTKQPSSLPSSFPKIQPSTRPSNQPTIRPSVTPSTLPTTQPTIQPTSRPSCQPSGSPSMQPTSQPTVFPSGRPSAQPSSVPSSLPITVPSSQPSCGPSSRPSIGPSIHPSSIPSRLPTSFPSSELSLKPNFSTTNCPTVNPTVGSSVLPSVCPTVLPSTHATDVPSRVPTETSSSESTTSVSVPSVPPTIGPTVVPSCSPTNSPAGEPSCDPSTQPTSSPVANSTSSRSNHSLETLSDHPSIEPTIQPSLIPSLTPALSLGIPSFQPITNTNPTPLPSHSPSNTPSVFPSSTPSSAPSRSPTKQPISRQSSQPSVQPSHSPSSQPTRQPVSHPTSQPSRQPTAQPSMQPTSRPSSSHPTSSPTLASSAPTPLRAPSVTAFPSATKKPTRIPTIRPSFVPTTKPTSALSIVPNTRRFTSFLFLLGGLTFQPDPVVQDIRLNNAPVSGQNSFVIFGQKKKFPSNIVLGSRESLPLVTEISPSLSQDSVIRSTTVVGDINGDSFPDLLVGYPSSSVCFCYLGTTNGFINLVVSFVIHGPKETEFGWAVAGMNDINNDHCDDMIISAKASGIVYVLFGKPQFPNDINVELMTSDDGFKITGSGSAFHFGMSVANAGDFNNDGFTDILISTMTSKGQGVVYVLFGSNSFRDIEIASTENVFTMYSPPFSFASMSLAGLGDINNDGFGDIAIGSIPYQGRYLTQRTYIIYGREMKKQQQNESLYLSEMREGEDGIVITGGGFMVAGPGDLNGDGINDVMILNYPNWQGKQNSYLLSLPEQVSVPPTFLPSSSPSSQPSSRPSTLPTLAVTTETPTNHPSVVTFPPVPALEPGGSFTPSTVRPTRPPKSSSPPSFRPTKTPTVFPTEPPTAVPSIKQTSTPIPSTTMKPSKQPFFRPSSSRPISVRKTNFPTVPPTNHSSNYYSSLNESFQSVVCSGNEQSCQGNDQNQVFELTGSDVSYHIISRPGNSSNASMKIFVLAPAKNRIIIERFDLEYDALDLTSYYPLGIQGMEDLSYLIDPSLQLKPFEEQLIEFPDLNSFVLAEKNFIFSSLGNDNSHGNENSKESMGKLILTVAPFMVVLVFSLLFCAPMIMRKSDPLSLDTKKENLHDDESPNSKEATHLPPEYEEETQDPKREQQQIEDDRASEFSSSLGDDSLLNDSDEEEEDVENDDQDKEFHENKRRKSPLDSLSSESVDMNPLNNSRYIEYDEDKSENGISSTSFQSLLLETEDENEHENELYMDDQSRFPRDDDYFLNG